MTTDILTKDRVRIECAYPIEYITGIGIESRIGEHGKISVTGVLSEEERDSCIDGTGENDRIVICETDETEDIDSGNLPRDNNQRGKMGCGISLLILVMAIIAVGTLIWMFILSIRWISQRSSVGIANVFGIILFIFSLLMILLVLVFAFYSFCKLITKLHRYMDRKSFHNQLNQLSRYQMEMWHTEYPSRKRVEVPLALGKRGLKLHKSFNEHEVIDAFYITSNFWFIPNRAVICKENLKAVNIMHIGEDNETFAFFFRAKGKNSMKEHIYRLTLKHYDYRTSPKVAEELMAWFWGCAPDDPANIKRTKNEIEADLSSWRNPDWHRYRNIEDYTFI